MAKKKEFAPGIKSKKDLGDITKLPTNELVTLLLQQHKADKAGLHTDYRIGTPEAGLISFATKKKIPEPGEKPIVLHRQPVHNFDYKDFEGEIPEGYGAGIVRKMLEEKVLVTGVTPDKITFTTAEDRYPQRFALVKPKTFPENQFLLMNTTKTEKLPYAKVHYKVVPLEQAEAVLKALQPGSSVSSKIDGASVLIPISKKGVEVASYRTSGPTGRPIVHTERLFGGRGPELGDLPSKYEGSQLKGEIYGSKGNGTIPAHVTGGLLNSAISKSLTNQKENKTPLKTLLYDITHLKGKPIGHLPYNERLYMLKDIIKYLPQDRFHLPDIKTTPEEATKLFKDTKAGRNPLTREGVVIHPKLGIPEKIKLHGEHDVLVKGFTPGTGRLAGNMVGGFYYAHPSEPDKIVGIVGGGLSDELRKDMFEHPEDYLGRTARVRAQEKYNETGALRSPRLLSLHALHEDY